MLEHIASQVCNSAFYKSIPEVSKKLGVLELSALLGESLFWNVEPRDGDEEVLIAFWLGALKIIQITTCLGSIPYFASYKWYLPAVIITGLVTEATHLFKKTNKNYYLHSICGAATLSLNIISKVINSFAIGQMMHHAFYKDQKPRALMLGATLIMLGLSSLNVIRDWNYLAKLRGDSV